VGISSIFVSVQRDEAVSFNSLYRSIFLHKIMVRNGFFFHFQ